jgi:DNA-binding transcriptional regulator YdaS (Cro superfamily)
MEIVAQKQHFDKLLEIFGGYKEMAQKLNMKYVTVYAWSMRNSIPKKHHQAIIAASEGRLTAEDLG